MNEPTGRLIPDTRELVAKANAMLDRILADGLCNQFRFRNPLIAKFLDVDVTTKLPDATVTVKE